MTLASVITERLEERARYPLLTDIFPSVYRALGADIPRTALDDQLAFDHPTSICVVLIDGMGHRLIGETVGHTPFLRSIRGDIIEARTVVPSTTAAAITSLATGASPGQTRMVGWSVKDHDDLTVLLSFDGSSQPPELWQPHITLFERGNLEWGIESVRVLTEKFAHSGLTRAALRGAVHVSAETWDKRITAALDQMRAGIPVVYLYWSELDHVGHGHGWTSSQWTEELERVDAGLARLARECPADCAIVVTADHGMVDTSAQYRIDIADHPCLTEGLDMIAGEGRSVHIHCEANRYDLLDTWESFIGERGTIVRRGDLAEVLGGRAGADLVGDGLLLMHDNWVCVDSRVQSEGMVNLIGVHGSISEDEMAIPIIRIA
ncbi:MAG: alkaline phosphatase family protein [Actinomycetaceae bacterium]|nr:alkaline phosphatase family protein [Actinomycetaceae bacterium]